MSLHASARRGLIGSIVAGLVVTPLAVGLAAAPVQAASTGLVINEIYLNGGSANATYTNKYVELRNLGSTAVNLTGMSIQYRAPTSTGASTGNAALTGTIPANGYYVVVAASNGTVGAAVPASPGQTSTSLNPGGAGGTLTLVTGNTAVDPSSSTAVVDKIGYGTSNTPEGTAATGNTVTKSIARTGLSTDTDANGTDFAAQDPTPGALNVGGTNPGSSPLAATNPGNKTGVVGTAITPFTIAASGGTSPYSWASSTLPAGLSISTGGQVSGTPTAAGTSNVTATVTDSATPTPASASTSFTYTVNAAPAAQNSIAEIQGTTDTTPFNNQTVTTTGVVTAAFPTGGLNGFYLQTGGPDATPDASDGIFVFGSATNLPAASYPAVGTTVTVTGTAKEFATGPTGAQRNQTEIELTAPSSVTTASTAQPAVVAKTVVPGTTCTQGECPANAAAIDALREKTESELYAPTGDYTVTDPYDGSPFPSTSSANFGEIGLAAESNTALIQPTELYDTQTQAQQITDRVALNNAKRIILDDGSGLNYTTAANTDKPLPWFTPTHYVRVGSAVTFPKPVVLTPQFDGWTFLPSGGQVTGDPTGNVNFSQNRPAAPGNVGGDIKLATANVLNYFPTTGNEYVASSLGTCTYFYDRRANGVTSPLPDAAFQVTNNSCNPNGPRGAANDANLKRQQDKIVSELNGLGASIIALEEVENSVKFGKDRDFAVGKLVEALNAEAGAGTWAFAPSPSAANLPTVTQQDVIRNAFIYKPAVVSLVGASKVLTTESSDTAPIGAFSDAREPLAQGFKGVNQGRSKAFTVITNHFKSKGSGTPDPIQGNANDRRILQANALKTFAQSFSDNLNGSGAIFLSGDFNAYEEEDPIQVLTSGGYSSLDSTTTPGEASYSFSGLDGSLDHVLANAKAEAMVTGVDIWNINANESVYQEYSRFNYNVTNLYNTSAFRASDHNPEVVGLSLDGTATPPVDVQILATNDFHGRLANEAATSAAGAAVLAGAVKQFKAANPATSFVAAGDLIGASTFESFIQQDKPTIDALNEAGLDVSAAGNHEFDKGYADLKNRVIAPYDAQTNPFGGARWKYIAANVKVRSSGNPALDPSFIKNQGGVKVGYVGAVTEDLPQLVSPGGIADIEVTNIVTAVNAEANAVKAAGADLVVLLVHEGAATTSCDTIAADSTSAFGKITAGVNANIDAIVSGHTHLAYNCSVPVAGWADRPVKERPVVSAGQYGSNLNKLNFTVDRDTGVVQAKTQSLEALKRQTGNATYVNNFPADPATQTIVDNAVNQANVLGAQPLGKIAGAFNRAKLSNGTTENRGGESTLGNLVAEIQRDQTSAANRGGAQIAFMNPGGLRADLVGQGTGAFPRTATFKDAANVQPFANTLVNEALTGAQIKAALEQQWQLDANGNVPSRPFLKLGTSKGFRYTYDPAAAQGSRIKTMSLNGTPISLTETYSVTVNSFLATGGDNFRALNGTARKQDTGVTDLQAQVDYFAANAAGETGLPVDYSQRSVGVTNQSANPTAGKPFGFDLTSLSMTGPGDTTDTSVDVRLGDALLGSFPVTTTIGTATFDEVGTATVSVLLPATSAGDRTLVVTGNNTGTVARVPVTVAEPPTVDLQVLATNDFHGRIQNDSASASAGAAVLAGAVKQLRAANPNTTFAAAGDLIGASTFESFIQQDKPTIDALNEAGLEVSAAGNHEFDKGYDDLVNRVLKPYNADTNPYGGANWKYLGANLKFKDSGNPALDPTFVKTQAGVQIGYIGAVTEHLPELVSPGGISNIQVTNIATAVNTEANALKAEGVEVIVLLVHEGAAGTDCATINTDTTSDFGKITSAVNNNIDAIVSGHTHLTYNCSQPVPGWADRPVKERPIVSAGQYGTNLNQLIFTVNRTSGVVEGKTQQVLALKSVVAGSNPVSYTNNYPADSATQTIVTNAVNQANVLGAQPLGNIAGPFSRAKLANGTTENRGGESTLGNLVAEIQRDQTSAANRGAAQVAFMNPGGLRQDLVGQGTAAYPRVVTFKDAANVQPFANTLVNEALTGAQIKAALEQQWQPDGASRPFLKLGISKGFSYTYDPAAARGSRIKTMTLNGTPIDLATTYSVTVNSFLSTGGDNFTALNGAARKQDTGVTDLQAQVDYFAANASGSAGLPVDYSQRAVGVTLPADAPATYPSGGTLTANLSSLSMTGPGDTRDTTLTATIDGATVGTVPVTTTLQTALPGYDEVGTAAASITLPPRLSGGAHQVVFTGTSTGTVFKVPFTVEAPPVSATTVTGEADPVDFGKGATVRVTVAAATGSAKPTGTVTLRNSSTEITVTLVDGKADIAVPASALSPGDNTFALAYSGAEGFTASTGSVTVTVRDLSTVVTGFASSVRFGQPASMRVVVDAPDSTLVPTGTVRLLDGTTEIGTVTLVNGEGSITVPASALESGRNAFTLSYGGARGFAPSTGSATVTVNDLATSVSGTIAPVRFGSDAVVEVVVDATNSDLVPTGTVRLLQGSTQVGTVTLSGGAGEITIPASALERGNNSFTLSYLGDDGFEPSTSTVSVFVDKTAAVVEGTATTVTYGEAGSIPVRVGPTTSATPTGTVTVKNGSTTLATVTLDGTGAGTATIPALSLEAGTYALTLDYSGDDTFTTDSDTVTYTVNKAASATEATASTTTVQVKRNRSRFTVDVSAPGYTPTGTVEVEINGGATFSGTLVDGVASILVGPWTSVGTFDATVTYRGDTNTRASSDTISVKVTKQTPTLRVTAPTTVRKGTRPTVTATLTGFGGTVVGQVRFRYDGKLVVRTLSGGKASLQLPALSKNTVVTATYLGTSNYAVVSQVKTIRVVS